MLSACGGTTDAAAGWPFAAARGPAYARQPAADAVMAAEILFALALVAANGFFVAAEFAIARLRPTQVADFVSQTQVGAKSAQHRRAIRLALG
jgi:hypothetical protein